MQNYISNAGGYLTNPDATSSCQFCSSRTTDQFLGPSFNIQYSHHWRNVGFLAAYILFNVSLPDVSFVFNQTEGIISGILHLSFHIFIPHSHWLPPCFPQETVHSQERVELDDFIDEQLNSFLRYLRIHRCTTMYLKYLSVEQLGVQNDIYTIYTGLHVMCNGTC